MDPMDGVNQSLKRYASVSDQEILEKSRRTNSQQTLRANRKAANALRYYLEEKNQDTRFETLDEARLAEVLGRFYLDVRKSDGDFYKLKSLECLRYSLNRYLQSPPFDRKIDLMKDPVFHDANENFKAAMAELKQVGKGEIDHYKVIEFKEEDRITLYSSLYMSQNTPLSLQNKVQFDIRFHFCRRAVENLHGMTKDTFAVRQSSETGLTYVIKVEDDKVQDKLGKKQCKNNFESISGIMLEAPGMPSCPVHSYEKYISKLHPDNNSLWQRPRNMFNVLDTIWYCNSRLSEKNLRSFMTKLSKKCQLSENYNNHSIGATGATILSKNMLYGVALAGHRSKQSKHGDTEKVEMQQDVTKTYESNAPKESRLILLTCVQPNPPVLCRAIPSELHLDGGPNRVHTGGSQDVFKLPALKVLGEAPVIYSEPTSMQQICSCDKQNENVVEDDVPQFTNNYPEPKISQSSERVFKRKVSLKVAKPVVVPPVVVVPPAVVPPVVVPPETVVEIEEENIAEAEPSEPKEAEPPRRRNWSVKLIKDSDEKTRIYTGLLSWSAFLNLYSILEHDITEAKCKLPDNDCMEVSNNVDLTLSDELFAVLATLKLGLFREDIASCLDIPTSTFDQIFSVWVSCLFSKLPEWSSISLPSNKQSRLIIPSIVRNTPNLKFVLCWLRLTLGLDPKIAEVGNSERPFKILLALNCSGNIVFSSGIWVQKAEGLMVATNSGILQLVDEGDSVIVPSDIDLASTLLSEKRAETITLPYDKLEEIETADHQTQSVYNFIEQSVNRLKVFGIMNRVVPPELLEASHKIIAVCSQLSNIFHS